MQKLIIRIRLEFKIYRIELEGYFISIARVVMILVTLRWRLESVLRSSRKIKEKERSDRARAYPDKEKCKRINHACASRVNLKKKKSPGKTGGRRGARAGPSGTARQAVLAPSLHRRVIVYCCESREIVSIEWSGTRLMRSQRATRRNIIGELFSIVLSLSLFLFPSRIVLAPRRPRR